MTEIPIPLAEWNALPKDDWDAKIRRWCVRNKHTQRVNSGGSYIDIPAKLPYRFDPDDEDRQIILVDEDFYASL